MMVSCVSVKFLVNVMIASSTHTKYKLVIGFYIYKPPTSPIRSIGAFVIHRM